MVHDEKPSDIWWHDTDTYVLRLFDQFRYLVDFGHAPTFGLVDDISNGLKAKLKEALLSDGYRAGAKMITRTEHAVTKAWHEECVKLTDNLVGRYHVVSRSEELDRNDLCPKVLDQLKLLRERIRDRYLFDRKVESRFGLTS